MFAVYVRQPLHWQLLNSSSAKVLIQKYRILYYNDVKLKYIIRRIIIVWQLCYTYLYCIQLTLPRVSSQGPLPVGVMNYWEEFYHYSLQYVSLFHCVSLTHAIGNMMYMFL